MWGTSVGARFAFAYAATKRVVSGREFVHAGVRPAGNPEGDQQKEGGTEPPEFRKYFHSISVDSLNRVRG